MRRWHAAPALAIAAGVFATVWWATSSSGTGAVMRARQAFGSARVVHVVATLGIDPRAPAMRSITSSEGIEVWYDTVRHRTHTVLRRGTKVVLDSVEEVQPPHVPPLNEAAPLYAFVAGYRPALTRGEYRATGSERIEGRHLVQLTAPADPNLPDVAIDPASYQPIWVGTDDSALTQIALAETKPYDSADFLTAKQRQARHL